MISINATLVLQVIHFLVLVFVLNRLMLQPLLRLIDERTQYIVNTKTEIENLEEETARLRDEFVAKETDARIEATQERAQLRSMGISETEEVLNTSRKEVASIRAEADQKAEKEFRKTQPFLDGQAAVLAEEIVEKVIGRRIQA
jgi:F-type H+-transporting ATPase subunit b